MVLTETNEIDWRKLPTDVLYAADVGALQAWELDTNQQARTEGKGEYVQLVSERSKKPLTVFKSRPKLQGRSTETIASQKQDEELTIVQTKSHKSSMLLWLGIITALLVLAFCIAVVAPVVKNTLLALAPALAIWRKKEDTTIRTIDDIKRETGLKTGTVNAYIFVESTGEIIEREIDRAHIPNNSIQRKEGKTPVYILGLDGNGKLFAIEPENTILENDSPTDLIMALQYEQEVGEFYGLGDSTTEKIKFGIFVGLIILIVIVLFIYGFAVYGGGL